MYGFAFQLWGGTPPRCTRRVVLRLPFRLVLFRFVVFRLVVFRFVLFRFVVFRRLCLVRLCFVCRRELCRAVFLPALPLFFLDFSRVGSDSDESVWSGLGGVLFGDGTLFCG